MLWIDFPYGKPTISSPTTLFSQPLRENQFNHPLDIDSSSCSKPRFKRLSRNIFGHSGVTHQLVTQTELAQKKFNLRVGQEVSFEYDGEGYHGIISKITKRATVMVSDLRGAYRDSRGRRYSKYYIPLHLLKQPKHTNRSKNH